MAAVVSKFSELARQMERVAAQQDMLIEEILQIGSRMDAILNDPSLDQATKERRAKPLQRKGIKLSKRLEKLAEVYGELAEQAYIERTKNDGNL